MTIKLDAAANHALVMGIMEGLHTVTPKAGYLELSLFSWAKDLMLALPDDARTKIDRFCGENGLATLIRQEVSIAIKQSKDKIDIEPGIPLTDISIFKNTLEFSKVIVEKIQNLPIRYRVTVALPSYFSDPINEINPYNFKINNNISILSGDKISGVLPLNSEYPNIDSGLFYDWFEEGTTEREIIRDRLYFSMNLLGYASHGSSTLLGRSFEDHLKAFYGAAAALGLISYGWGWRGGRKSQPYMMIHSDDKERILIETERLEKEFETDEWHNCTEVFAKNHSETIKDSLNKELSKISAIFSDNIDCRRLFTACIWYHRARVNVRQLDKLLEANIAIEVLLGDRTMKEGLGLTNLLGNRCAFLLGENSKERENILSTFNSIYKLRSIIVHEGKHRAESSDINLVNDAISLCGRIIKKEILIRG